MEFLGSSPGMTRCRAVQDPRAEPEDDRGTSRFQLIRAQVCLEQISPPATQPPIFS